MLSIQSRKPASYCQITQAAFAEYEVWVVEWYAGAATRPTLDSSPLETPRLQSGHAKMSFEVWMMHTSREHLCAPTEDFRRTIGSGLLGLGFLIVSGRGQGFVVCLDLSLYFLHIRSID